MCIWTGGAEVIEYRLPDFGRWGESVFMALDWVWKAGSEPGKALFMYSG